ncbi:hypothetical protein Tco_0514828 [Tanacetum coccineum]
MFMANFSSADPVYDETGPSYDSDTISKVQDHVNCLDNMNESHEEHEMHHDNEDQVVHSDVSSVPNDAVMIITNDIYDQDAPCVTSNMPNNTVDASLTAKLARYKELAKAYEKRAQFELTERELLIDTQIRMIIKDRNVKKESLQKELQSVKMQLNSTLNHNKFIREEVSTLKEDFKQKENKLLEEFLDMKHLKEKVKDKLYKQDQSLQIVHVLCKPKSFYNEINRVAIGYKNPFYLSKAKQVHLALYNGHEIVKTNHARALVHDSEDTLEIAETTRKQIIEKMKDPECVKKKIFWSDDLLKMKAKALKKKAKSTKPITTMTVYPPNTPAKLVPKVLPIKKIQAVERKRNAKNILLMAIPKEHMRRFHGMMMQKTSGAIRTKSSTNKVKSGFTSTYSTCTPSTSSTNTPEKEALADSRLLYNEEAHKKIGRKRSCDGKAPVGFDKKKLEFFNCHNIHFSRECIAKGTHDEKKKRDSFYQHQEAGKQEKNQMGLLTTDDGIVNWGEHTVDEETNHALMAISSSSEVSLCSKTFIDSYNTLKTPCGEQMNQLGVPHPLSGDYTPTPQEEIDESLYVYGKKGPQEPEPNVLDDRSSEYSTCQSNDSVGSIRTSTEHSVDPESEISRVSQEVYLIKDCDYYEKKMAREAEFKKQRGFNTGNMLAKPVWTNTDRINHANQFVLRPVQLNTGRPNINSVRTNIKTDLDSQYLPGSQTALVLKDHRSSTEEHVDRVLWNYIPVSLENQANPHASASEVTNSACTLQTLNANASEEKDEDAELIVVPSAVKNTKEKVERGDFDRTSTRE